MTAVATVQSALAKMPPESTFDDIMYQVYVINEIEKGLADANAGRLIPHDEVKKGFEEWRRSRGLPPRAGI